MRIHRFLALTVGGLLVAAASAAAPVPILAMPAGAPDGGWPAPALMVGLALATLASEDLTCIAAGVLVADGTIGLVPATLGCAAGIFVGDFALYLSGRYVGRPIAGRWPFSTVLAGERIACASAWLEARGTRVLAGSRFVPGTRVATYVAAGVLGIRASVCARALALSALAWTPLLVGASALATRLGFALAPRAGVLALGLVLGVLFCAWQAGARFTTHERRRTIVSWWRRITRWEFWPAWALYPPVVAWMAMLMVRHRSATVFTAANPGIPAAGFVGESKSAILGALARGGAPVAPFQVLRGSDAAEGRAVEARRFAGVHGLPVVLKPDQGQRGTGVRILRSPGALEAAARALTTDHVLQAYVGGLEFGVFYARRPHEPRGRIVSLAAKQMATVVGDGRRTLDRLIVDDPRAVALARVYRAVNRGRLATVPREGEVVPICELGTHCRGAIFRDAARLLTPTLDRAVDEAARAMPGFSFGRFDVRADSEAAFREGRFRILELNGVTSEPAHIYDPAASVLSAWRTLCQTWQLAFEIGQAQAALGARVWSVRELLGCAVAYRRFARASAAATGGTVGGGRHRKGRGSGQ